MRVLRAVGVALVLLGIGSISISLASGSSHLYLLLVIPVVTGSSAWFLGGTASLLIGLILFAVGYPADRSEGGGPDGGDEESPDRDRAGSSGGGVVLIGPIPIFFGGARQFADRYYWLALGAGAATFAAVLVVLYLA
jgi:uncharacterized membrane protein